MISRALVKSFPCADFYSAVQEAAHKRVPEPRSLDTVAAKLIGAPSFTVPVTKFVKQEVEKNSVDNTKKGKRFVKLAEAVEEQKIKVEDEIATRNIDTT